MSNRSPAHDLLATVAGDTIFLNLVYKNFVFVFLHINVTIWMALNDNLNGPFQIFREK